MEGSRNALADALSKDNLDYFLSCFPQANPVPTSLPHEFLNLTLISKPDWTLITGQICGALLSQRFSSVDVPSVRLS